MAGLTVKELLRIALQMEEKGREFYRRQLTVRLMLWR